MSLLSLDDTGHALQRRQGAHKVFTARNDRRVVGGVKSAPSNHVGPMPFSYNDVAVRHCDAEAVMSWRSLGSHRRCGLACCMYIPWTTCRLGNCRSKSVGFLAPAPRAM